MRSDGVLTTVAVVSCVLCVLNVRFGLTDDIWTASLEYGCVLALRFERPRETCLLQYLRFGCAFWKISTWPYMCHFFRIYHRIDRLPGCILYWVVPSWCLSGCQAGANQGCVLDLLLGVYFCCVLGVGHDGRPWHAMAAFSIYVLTAFWIVLSTPLGQNLRFGAAFWILWFAFQNLAFWCCVLNPPCIANSYLHVLFDLAASWIFILF